MLMIIGLSFAFCSCLVLGLFTEIAALRGCDPRRHFGALAWVFLSVSVLFLQSSACIGFGLSPDRKVFIYEEGAGSDLCMTWDDRTGRTLDACALLVRQPNGGRLVRVTVPQERLATPERLLDRIGIRFSGEFLYRIEGEALWEADRVGISERTKLIPAEGIPACELSRACVDPFVDFVFKKLRDS